MRLSWQQGFSNRIEPDVRDLFASARAADGDGPLPDHRLDPGLRVLTATVDGRLAGVAWGDAEDPAELLVHPDFRHSGVGTSLATRLIDDGGRVWAHGNSPAAQALAAHLGLSPVRTLLQMRRIGHGEPSPIELPDGVRLRTFEIGSDEDAFLAVNARAFAWHPEQGRLDGTGLAAEMAEPWFDPPGFFLAVAGDRLLGFHWTRIHPVDPTPPAGAAPAPIGEVYVLGVDPESPIRRLGAPLTAAGLNYLAGKGLSTVMLYVESDNEPALRLYRRFGFEVARSDVVYAR